MAKQSNRDIFIESRSPESYIDEFNSEGEIRERSEKDGGSVVFEDKLE